MNNVVRLHNNPFDEFQDSHIFFQTWERPVEFTGNGKVYYKDDDHKVIVRTDPNNPIKPIPLGVVGSKYKVIRTRDICSAIEDKFLEERENERCCDLPAAKLRQHGTSRHRDYRLDDQSRPPRQTRMALLGDFQIVVIHPDHSERERDAEHDPDVGTLGVCPQQG